MKGGGRPLTKPDGSSGAIAKIPEIVTLGEAMIEFNAVEAGSLRTVRHYEVGWGGDTSNVAIAVSRLGGSAGYITRVGSDDFGAMLLDLWESEGVDTAHAIVESGAATGIYFIAREGQAHSFTYYRKNSAASHLSPADIPRDYVSQARVLHVSGITEAISPSACAAVSQAVEWARAANVLVSYDPNIRPKLWENSERAREIAQASIGCADIVFPSYEDAQFVTGLSGFEEIAERLLALGPRIVMLKLGGSGAMMATQEGSWRFAPWPVRVVDATGAGDTFVGAFLTAWARGCPPAESAEFANAAAALATTGPGAVVPIPRRSDVEALLRTGKRA